MPDYEVTSPEGKSYIVTAPEGATKEQIYAYAKRQADTTPPASQPEQGRDWLREIGLAGGAAFKGAMTLPDLLANAGRDAVNMGSSVLEKIPGMPKQNRLSSQSSNDLLKYLGADQPETPSERVTSDAIGGGVSALAGPGKVGKNYLAGLLAGGGAGMTREMGGGTGAQLGVGLLAGMTPQMLASIAKAPGVRDVTSVIGSAFNNKASHRKLAEDTAQRISGADKDFIRSAELNGTNYLGPNVPVTTAQALAQRNAMTQDVRAGSTVKLQQELTGAQGATDVLPSVAKRQFTAMETPLQGIAGGADRATQDASQAIAKQFRADNAGKQYEALARTQVPMTSDLSVLLGSPAGRDAYRLAKSVAENDNAARIAAGGKAIPFEFTNKDGKIIGFTAQGLQNIKATLDNMSTSPTLQSSIGITGQATNKVGGVRDELVGLMNKAIPGWQDARQAYSAQSEPLNRLQVGQALLDKFRNEKGAPTALTFLNARGKGEDALLKRSTGAGREVNFAPADEAALEGIQSHLLRDEAVKRIGGEVKGGAGGGLASQDIPQLPNLLSRTAMIANYGLRMFGKSANDPVANLIAHKMANGTYSELLQRPVGDPLRTATEAMLRAALGTAATVKEEQ